MLKKFPACAYCPYRDGEEDHRFYVLATSADEALEKAKSHATELSFGRVFLETWEGIEVTDLDSVA